MQPVLTKSEVVETRLTSWVEPLHAPEYVALAYFLYLFCFSILRQLSAPRVLFLTVWPALLLVAWRAASRSSAPWVRILREWCTLGLILVGYWALAWFAAKPRDDWQQALVTLDRLLLDQLGLRAWLEAGGAGVPNVLETVYLLLYAIPGISLIVQYVYGVHPLARRRYLFILLLGTFTAYSLLPHFPLVTPRLAFPSADLPHFQGLARQINTWVLDRYDISTGVFPSGHVAVAFSSAFGLFSVLRGRRRVWLAAFATATLVYLATVYGRYHFAVDGLCSFLIAVLAWRAGEYFFRHGDPI